MKKFIESQKTKFGYDDTTELNGYTVKELEEHGSRIACNQLSEIFKDYFDQNDTHRFWFNLQMGVYEIRKESLDLHLH